MVHRVFGGALAALLLAHTGPVSALQAPATAEKSAGEGLRHERELLANYRWRLKTEMKVDGVLRLTRLEDVNLGPTGGFQKKLVKFDRAPEPTPVAYGDPRFGRSTPSQEDDDRFFDTAQFLMEMYARISPGQVDAWKARAKLLPPDPDRPGLLRMEGRGLGRSQDDAVAYLDPKTWRATQIEVKTTVSAEVKEIAFIRATFEQLKPASPESPAVLAPKKIFLNMSRAGHSVTLEMETSDWRTWR
ncbi:MAG: hypothetical protein ACHQPI_11270 [Thermoanaerobaculia bacterium]